MQINKNIACDFLISLHFGVEKFLSTKNSESPFVHCTQPYRRAGNPPSSLHSDFVVVCQRIKPYCAQPNGFTCQPLRGLVHASIARGITASFISGKIRFVLFILALNAKHELSNFFTKKHPLLDFFSILTM